MASYANPQSLNRYSYVSNNPLRYTDPTGHMLVEDSGGAGSVCPDQKCKDDVQRRRTKHQHHSDPWDDNDPWDEAWADWTTHSYPWKFPVAGSWGGIGPQEIEPMEFEQMLKSVGDDLHGFPTLGWYDTPFYNAGGKLTGIGCVNGKCYDRSELNYIGEGEALAKLGLSRDATHNVVFIWKNKWSLLSGLVGLDSTTKPVSQGTYEMTDIGWSYYFQHYGGAP